MQHTLHHRAIAVLFVLFLVVSSQVRAQVGIGTVTPNANSILELSATDKALILPRLTGTGAIATPAAGMLIYNTTDGRLYWYDANTPAWQLLSAGSATGVAFNDNGTQVATQRNRRLFDVTYTGGATTVDGARIASGSTGNNATGLTVNTIAGAGNTATGLVISATGGANNYAALFTGNVGIGTATPASPLEVNGNIGFTAGGARLVSVAAGAAAGDNLVVRAGNGGAGNGGNLNLNAGNGTGGNGGNALLYGGTGTLAGNTFLAHNGFIPVGNVGVRTNTPALALDVAGGIGARPTSAAAAAAVNIPNNVSAFNLTNVGGGATSALTVTTPQDGQLLTIYNFDDNTATFAGFTINAFGGGNPGVGSFAYINTAWRQVSSSASGGGGGWTDGGASVTLSTITDNVGIGTATPVGVLHVQGTQTAAVGTAYAQQLTTTLTAAANNDRLVGLRVLPTYTPGAFTGVSFRAIEGTGDVVLSNDDTPGRYDGLNLIKFGATTPGPRIVLTGGRGSIIAPAATQANDILSSIETVGNTGAGSGSAAFISAQATEAWTGAANGTQLIFGTTANGTTATNTRMTISNQGAVAIGATAPTAVFDINYSSGATALANPTYLKVSPTGTAVTGVAQGLRVDMGGISGGALAYSALFMNGNVGIGTLTPRSNLHVIGSTSYDVSSTAVPLNLDIDQHFVLVTANGADLTLPGPSANNVGRTYYFSFSAAPGSQFTLFANGNTINGTAGNLTIDAAAVVGDPLPSGKLVCVANGAWVALPFEGTSNANSGVEINPNGTNGTTFVGEVNNSTITANNNNNTFVGFQAGQNTTGGAGLAQQNTFIGSRAGQSNTTGQNNTLIGFNVAQSQTNAGANTIIGTSAASSGTFNGGSNTIVGQIAGQSLTTGSSNVLMGQGAGAIGVNALTTGQNNTFIGFQTASTNVATTGGTALGYIATVGDNGVAIGLAANASANEAVALGRNASATAAGAVAIGANVTATTANTIVLGDGTPNYSVGIGTPTPIAKLDVKGSFAVNSVATTAGLGYVVGATEVVITTSGTPPYTITLPTPNTVNGRILIIKAKHAPGIVTVQPATGTIDGAATQALTNPQSLILVADGPSNNWVVINAN